MRVPMVLALTLALSACAGHDAAPPSYSIDAPDAPLLELSATPRKLLTDAASLSDWDVFLGPAWHPGPHAGGQVALNPPGQAIFTLGAEEGVPVLRVEGSRWGALTSRFEVENFELKGEYRWGSIVHPQLGFRDSGIMIHSFGIFGAVDQGGGSLAPVRGQGHFMASLEYQIAQGDIGSPQRLGPISFDSRTFVPGASIEKPLGRWNSWVIQATTDEIRFFLNGSVIQEIHGLRRTDLDRALTRGRVQLQSEGTEIFFRGLEIRSLLR